MSSSNLNLGTPRNLSNRPSTARPNLRAAADVGLSVENRHTAEIFDEMCRLAEKKSQKAPPKTPHFDEFGIELISHPAHTIYTDNGRALISFSSHSAIHVMGAVYKKGVEPKERIGGADHGWRGQDGLYYVDVIFQEAGEYEVVIFAKLVSQEGPNMVSVTNYHVKSSTGTGKLFPSYFPLYDEAGFLTISHPYDGIESTDGSPVEVTFSGPKGAHYMGKLTNNNNEKVDGATMIRPVPGGADDDKYEMVSCVVVFKDPGEYQLSILASLPGAADPGLLNGVVKYHITSKVGKGLEACFPTFYAAWEDSGVILRSHTHGYIMAEKPLRMTFGTRGKATLMGELMVQDSNQKLDLCVDFKREGEDAVLYVLFPKSDTYTLNVFVRQEGVEGNQFNGIVKYTIKSGVGTGGGKGFPQFHDGFDKGCLILGSHPMGVIDTTVGDLKISVGVPCGLEFESKLTDGREGAAIEGGSSCELSSEIDANFPEGYRVLFITAKLPAAGSFGVRLSVKGTPKLPGVPAGEPVSGTKEPDRFVDAIKWNINAS